LLEKIGLQVGCCGINNYTVLYNPVPNSGKMHTEN
jgi:hypothetical protein